ncbi:MAG: hypothetical protein MJK12_15975 [Colwellia sp.]|nr:hypothetical protein [Colwellia sp.]
MTAIVTPDKIKAKSAYRELIFENVGLDEESLSLMIRDSSVDGKSEGFYKIPLYHAASRENNSTESDIELVHIYPVRYGHAEPEVKEHMTHLRDGYLYIYVNGHIWRELKVTQLEKQPVAVFNDVNLAYQKGDLQWKSKLGRRDSTGETLKTVLVPHKMQGEVCEVQIAYSETQWAWKQIEAFGGLSPVDPRNNYGEPVKPGINDGDAQERRAQRMQSLTELGNYQKGFSNNGLPSSLVIAVANEMHVYAPVIKDEIGKMREAAKNITLSRKEIEMIDYEILLGKDKEVFTELELSQIIGKKFNPDKIKAGRYSIASVVQSSFFAFPHQVQDKIKTMGQDSVDEAEIELASDYKKWIDDNFDKQEFKDYLKTNKAFSIAGYINKVKIEVNTLVRDEEQNGSFYQSAKDYAYHGGNRRLEIYEMIADVVAPLKDSTADLIRSRVIDDSDHTNLAKIDKEDKGQDTVLKIIGRHLEDIESPQTMLKLVKLLYPKAVGEGLTEYESYREAGKPYDVTFDVDEFKEINETDDGLIGDGFQVVRRAFQAVWGLLNITLEVPTAMYALGKNNQPIYSAYTKRFRQGLKKSGEGRKLATEIKNIETAINTYTVGIARAEQEYKSIITDSGIEGPNQKVAATLSLQIKEQKIQLGHLQDELKRAKAANVVTKRHLANLSTAGQNILKEHGELKIKHVAVRHNPYIKFMHLSDMVSNGLIKEIDIDANQYLKGELPKGMLPLNFFDRAKRAGERLNAFNRVSDGLDGAMNDTSNQPTTKLKITDQHSITARLDHLVNLDGSLDELQHMFDQQLKATDKANIVLNRKLMVLDESKLNLEGMNSKLEGFEDQLLDVKKDIKQSNWERDGYSDQNKSLRRYAKWNIEPKYFNTALNGVLPVVSIMEAVNFYTVMQKDGINSINGASAALDLADIMVNIGANLVERKYGLPTAKQQRLFFKGKNPTSALQKTVLNGRLPMLYGRLGLIIGANTLSFLASGVSAYIAVTNAHDAYQKGNTAQMFGYSIMASGFTCMTITSAFALFGSSAAFLGPLAAVGLILILIAAGLLWWFSEAEIESWLQACPWGRNRYINDDSNDSSSRASQWQTRPDYALLDLYNVFYRPQINFEHSQITQTCKITFSAPIVAPVNGVTIDFKWRKLKKYFWHDDNEFNNISLKQMEQLTDAKWQLFPNRTGWQVSFTYHALRKMLNLAKEDAIEFCVVARVYPVGKGGKVIPAFDTEYVLPSTYYSDPNANNKNKPKLHKAGHAQALRHINFMPIQYGHGFI